MKRLFGVGLVAAAVAVVSCGCGNSAENGKGATKNIAECPRIAEGSSLAFGFSDVQSGALKPVVEKIKKAVKKGFGESVSKSDQKEVDAFLKNSGLENASINWAVLSVGKVGDIKKEVPEIGIALAFDHDSAKLVAEIRRVLGKENKGVSLEDLQVKGAKAWVVKGAEKEFKPYENVRPCFSSLAGKLLLVGMNEAALAKQIALYTEGTGEGADWKTFTVNAARPLNLRTLPIGEVVSKAFTEKETSFLDALIPNGGKMIRRLGALEISFAAQGQEKAILELSLGTGAAEDADAILALVKTGMMALKAPMATAAEKGDAEAKLALDVLNAIKFAQEGATIKVSIPMSVQDLVKAMDKALEA